MTLARHCRTAAALLLAMAILLPRDARAFTIKVHIHLANAIHDDLVRNWAQGGAPRVRLLGPDDAAVQYVRLPDEDARAIRDHLDFFRGGAIGPDNTVMPGLTDPSHSWLFQPFSQCQALYDASQTSEERAYALGCFLHGVSDNAAHHMVNFFTGETFTLTPIESAQEGELQWSLLNVVRHMVTEGRMEDAIRAESPDALTPDRMRHRIAVDLYRRVYLDRGDGRHGLWHYFAGALVQRKNDALAAAQLEGLDPTTDLELTIEEIREQGLGRRLDRRVIDAYVAFLKTGSPVNPVAPAQLAPADYVLLLPEIVEDMRRLLEIVRIQGEDDLDAVEADCEEDGCNPILHPARALKLRLYRHLFAVADDGGPSRFDLLVERKNRELDRLVTGYIQSVERMSNLLVTTDLAQTNLQQIELALQPMADAIEAVTDFPYDLLFPQWAVTIIDNVSWVKSFLEGTFAFIKQELKARIVDFIAKHIEAIKAAILALMPEAVQTLREDIAELRERIHERVDEAKYRAIGLDLSPADTILAHPTRSVWAMNAFNSVAGTLANREVVFQTGPSGFYSGPVSFDASYQLTYNQLYACEDLRAVFYPCGVSASEMLQPDFRRCQTLPEEARMEPPVECHGHDATHFAESVTPEDCQRRTLDEIIDYRYGHQGSYTGAFPSWLAPEGPACIDPFDRADVEGAQGSGDLERRGAGLGSGTSDASFFGDTGCRTAPGGSQLWATLVGAVVVLACVRRRRSR